MIIDEIGELAIGLRLKRMYESFAQAVHVIYMDNALDFDAKYFGLFYVVSIHKEISVSDAAKELGLSHVGVIHLCRDLENKDLIHSVKSDIDSRKRLLKLTDKGKAALPAFERVWANIKALNQQLFNNIPNNLLSAITETEQLLQEKSYNQRYKEMFHDKPTEEIEIIGYKPELAKYFKLLNIEWINAYFTVEKHDLHQLDHPEESVLNGGGQILFARYKREIVGTCAIICTGPQEYELAKMGVSPQHRGKHIGDKLMQAAIEKVRDMKGKKIWLGSNKKLTPALTLYRKYAFKDVPLEQSPYSRADVRMELYLE